MNEKVYVIGVGMTAFEKPGRREDWDYPDMGREAGAAALADAGVDFSSVQEAVAGYCYGDSTCGQRAIYELGTTGIPIVNVNNNCSTGTSALYLAARAVAGGFADCTLALGFEKMQPGSLDSGYADREQPLMRHIQAMAEIREFAMPVAPWMFGVAGVEHMERYGSTPEHHARIAEKNHRHSAANPRAQFQQVYTLEEIQSAKMVYEPLGMTRLMCSPTSDGSAAAVLASERFVDEHGLGDRAVEICGQALVTDLESSFTAGTARAIVGTEMSAEAARRAYRQASVEPDDIDVIELHDCSAPNELLTYEALGLAEEGCGHHLVDSGDTTYGGRWVVNPSGGLISKGHPLGATGLAQCAELTWQLRGEAEGRQVESATRPGGVAVAHNIGLGGAAFVTVYRRASR